MFRFNLQYDTLLSGSPVLIFFYSEIFVCEDIDVLISTFTNLTDYTTSDRHFAVRILLIYDVDCDSRITCHVPLFQPAYNSVNQDEIPFVVNPYRRYLG